MKIEIKKKGFDTHKEKDQQKLRDLYKEIELQTGIKIVSKKDNDVVDGYVNTYGEDITIHLYEKDEAPCKKHTTTFKKKIPTQAEIDKIKQIIESA